MLPWMKCLMNREKYRKQTWTEKKKIKCYFIRRRTCSPWWQATVSTTMQTLPPSPPRSISRTDFSLYQNHNIQPLVQGEHATVILFLNLRAPKKTFLFFPMIRCNPVWFCKWTDVYFYISVLWFFFSHWFYGVLSYYLYSLFNSNILLKTAKYSSRIGL